MLLAIPLKLTVSRVAGNYSDAYNNLDTAAHFRLTRHSVSSVEVTGEELLYSLSRLVSLRFSAATRRLHS